MAMRRGRRVFVLLRQWNLSRAVLMVCCGQDEIVANVLAEPEGLLLRAVTAVRALRPVGSRQRLPTALVVMPRHLATVPEQYQVHCRSHEHVLSGPALREVVDLLGQHPGRPARVDVARVSAMVEPTTPLSSEPT